MNRVFPYFAYLILIIVGGFMFFISNDGHIIKICIACNSIPQILMGGISMLTGLIGIIGTVNVRSNEAR